MDRRIFFGAALCAATVAAPMMTNAQSNGTQDYFTPPKLKKGAQPSVPVAGEGTVVVQVFVKADGTFTVSKILKSSNHDDDAAALDVAKHSTYSPATRGTNKVDAFYDFTLKFNASGASTSEESATGAAVYLREMDAQNYSGAKSGLTSYVAQHPDDLKAWTYLGVADTFLEDYEGAVAAFDKAGTIGDPYKAAAAKAYTEYAAAELKAKEYDKGVAAAKRAYDLQPGFYTQNTLGYAEFTAGNYAAAIDDLEKARALGKSDSNLKAHERIAVDNTLVAAYLASGKNDQAKTITAEITQLDPADSSGQNIMAASLVQQAEDAQKAGKSDAAAALFEQAAAAAPTQAATLYGYAATTYLAVKPSPMNDKAKTAADKALAIDPNNTEANFAEGLVLANTGKPKDALTFLNKAEASAKDANNAALTAQIDRAIKQLNEHYGKDNPDPKMQF
jgi:TonB family protein